MAIQFPVFNPPDVSESLFKAQSDLLESVSITSNCAQIPTQIPISQKMQTLPDFQYLVSYPFGEFTYGEITQGPLVHFRERKKLDPNV